LNPEELQEAADAIRGVRQLAAVQRHKELEDLLRRAEEWDRRADAWQHCGKNRPNA